MKNIKHGGVFEIIPMKVSLKEYMEHLQSKKDRIIFLTKK